jgi:hypothetical protein
VKKRTDLRTTIDQFIMLGGVALIVAPVTILNDSLVLLAFVLLGISMIAVGVWNLGSQLLPDRRVFTGLRQEVERFIDLVRRLNAHAMAENVALMEEARAAMHESVDRMFGMAGEPDQLVAGRAEGS